MRYFNIFLFLLSGQINAQSVYSITGIAFDSVQQQTVASATITLMLKKDSSLVSFAMTNDDGKFHLNNLNPGIYRLLITHVSYYGFTSSVELGGSEKTKNLGNVFLINKSIELKSVTITGEAPPVTLLNDTVQYNAASFKTAPNANVEQLLKKLPGVQVQKDGTIKAQGEKVTRVLVDGKEFFGNDPKLATKNLPADAVDKVQVYDKQSDQAQLTGIDDGNYEKTINLKLKEDKKKGAFGKISGSLGTDERLEGKFNVNKFKAAEQMSVIGMGNNTNAEGFSFMDILNFTGEMARMQRSGSGDININMNREEATALGINGGSKNSGINTAWGGGFNYNNIFGKDVDWQSNYFYNHFNPNTQSNVQRQYFLPDSTFYNTTNSSDNNKNESHRFNFNVLWQLDTFNSIRFTPSLTVQNTNNISQSDYRTFTQAGNTVNFGNSVNTTLYNAISFRNELLWRKKFRRKGRTFSLSFQNTNNHSTGDGNLISTNTFYDKNGGINRTDLLNQNSTSENSVNGFSTKAVYTEPITRKSLIEFSFAKSITGNSASKFTYDFNPQTARYETLNASLSNSYSNNYAYNTAGIRFRAQIDKLNMALGAYWQRSDLDGTIKLEKGDSSLGKTFYNILPTVRMQYNFTRYKSISTNYTVTVNAPTVQQLQPVTDNSNPLRIRQGNADLKQELVHSVQARLMLLSPFKQKNLFLFSNWQFIENKISNADSLTSSGITYTKPINTDGAYNLINSLNYSIPLHYLDATLNIGADANMLSSVQYVNNSPNTIQTLTLGPSVRIELFPTDNLDISVGVNINSVKSTYSLQSALAAKYISQLYSFSADWHLPKGFFLTNDFDYTINSQLSDGFNVRIPIWNISLSKMIMNNRGEIKMSVRDVLNQNVGINRNTNNNYIEDVRYNTLQRFFLLGFTWSLSKTGLNNESNGGMHINVK